MKPYSQIIINKGQCTFCTFSNVDGKMWVMPKRNMRTAMNLYQPSGIKGKLMKCFFPFLKSFAPVCKLLHVSVGKYELAGNVDELLKTVFRTDNLEFAFFGGTPSIHQKITLQISKGKKILGYCKVGDSQRIMGLFRHEQAVLRKLHEQGLNNIPDYLFCDELADGLFVFVQNTIKSAISKIVHKWTIQHVSFLKELHEKTQQECSFENTNFAKSIDYLATHTGLLGKNDVPYILEAITKVKAYFAQSERVNFSVYHGDFTPWNMFFEQGKLFVFDWEYAQMTYPPHLDSFHFFTQCCIFEQHLKSEEIYKLYTQRNPKLINYIENPDFYYICYLLDIISFYLKRNDDKKHNSINTSMAIWLKLITILVQQI